LRQKGSAMTDTISQAQLGRLSAGGRSILFTDARTANTFSDTPMSKEELIDIWELARWAPTSANVQPLRVVYVLSPDNRQRLLPHMDGPNRAKTAAAPAIAILAADLQFHDHIPRLMPFSPNTVYLRVRMMGRCSTMGAFRWWGCLTW
jgi:3-hydroxypropanoate dehydrogenase